MSSGIEPAGKTGEWQREHAVIRVEPRERLVAGLVTWSMLEMLPPGAAFVMPEWPEDDPRWDAWDDLPNWWCLRRLINLFADVQAELEVRRAQNICRHISEGTILRVHAADLVGGFKELERLERLADGTW